MIYRAAAVVALGAVLMSAQSRPPAVIAREMVDLMLAEKYADMTARFTEEMKKALPDAALREGASRFKQFGPVQKFLEPEVTQAQGMDVVIVPVAFEKLTVAIQVTVNKAGEVAGLFFRPYMKSNIQWTPPPYSKPESFRSEDVTVGSGEWQLPGTLLAPDGKGPFPGLVLVHGSGPNDRDETVGALKVFRDLAEGLASRGIVVLRYEKRTRQYASKLAALKEFTVNDETVDDAVAAAALLRTRPEVDPARVFVLGHSLGGYLAPRVGRRDPKLAGLIIMAGNTRPLEDLIVEQTAYLGSLQKDAGIEKKLEEFRRIARQIKDVKPGDNLPPVMGAPASYWLDLKTYRPADEARGLKMRLLVLQGERDYQVTMADFAGWKEALKDSATLKSYPSLNHLFTEGEGKSTPAEYSKPGHVAQVVIDDISAWIKAAAQ